MKKEAYCDTTSKAVGKRLKHIARSCLIENPETLKGFIAEKECSPAFKESLVEAYDLYCRANGIVWSSRFISVMIDSRRFRLKRS